MKIQYRAYNKKSWWQSQLSHELCVSLWNDSRKRVAVSTWQQEIRNRKGEHDCRVELTLEEACDLIDVLANHALTSCPDELEVLLQSRKNSIIQLLACAQGLKPKIPPPQIDRFEKWEGVTYEN